MKAENENARKTFERIEKDNRELIERIEKGERESIERIRDKTASDLNECQLTLNKALDAITALLQCKKFKMKEQRPEILPKPI